MEARSITWYRYRSFKRYSIILVDTVGVGDEKWKTSPRVGRRPDGLREEEEIRRREIKGVLQNFAVKWPRLGVKRGGHRAGKEVRREEERKRIE